MYSRLGPSFHSWCDFFGVEEDQTLYMYPYLSYCVPLTEEALGGVVRRKKLALHRGSAAEAKAATPRRTYNEEHTRFT